MSRDRLRSVSPPGLCAAALLLAACTAAPPPAPTPGDPRSEEPDFGPQYAWDLFLALNQPLAEAGPKVWELDYRQTSTIYLADGSQPAPWGQEPVPGELPPNPSFPCAQPDGVWHNLDTEIQVDGLTLLDQWGGTVRYQLLMDRPAFDYLLAREFYNLNGQTRAAQNGDPARFPDDASELKTSWIWIGTDEICQALEGKYYIVNAFFQKVDRDGLPDGYAVGAAALTGFHIINRELPDWVWITFENIHNPQFTQVDHELPLAEDVQAANAQNQAELRALGSIFAEYQLDGVQIQFTNTQGQPTLLANTNIESAFQTQSSCITCHALASIKPDGEFFNLVEDDGSGDLRYYVGDPPDVTAQGFTELDFVWSMKRASWDRSQPVEEGVSK